MSRHGDYGHDCWEGCDVYDDPRVYGMIEFTQTPEQKANAMRLNVTPRQVYERLLDVTVRAGQSLAITPNTTLNYQGQPIATVKDPDAEEMAEDMAQALQEHQGLGASRGDRSMGRYHGSGSRPNPRLGRPRQS